VRTCDVTRIGGGVVFSLPVCPLTANRARARAARQAPAVADSRDVTVAAAASTPILSRMPSTRRPSAYDSPEPVPELYPPSAPPPRKASAVRLSPLYAPSALYWLPHDEARRAAPRRAACSSAK